MAEIMQCDALDCDDRLFQERFLLLVQTNIQGLLNRKKLRYRDLSKRLGVSEARVSQMLSDEASNLTIRTLARIYHCLDETPLLVTQSAMDRIAGHLPACNEDDDIADWQVQASNLDTLVLLKARPTSGEEAPNVFRSPRNRDWIDAESALQRRA